MKTAEDLAKVDPMRVAEILGVGLPRAEEMFLDAKELISKRKFNLK